MDPAGLASEVVHGLAVRGLTISLAESCTGGQLAAAITAVPGSSAVFIGGIVAYANSVKQALLGVPENLLEKYGAVSSDCAIAMADGCRHGFATDFALSTTGIAGPGGGTPDKPVGLVYFGLAQRWHETAAQQMHFPGSRAQVQAASVEFILRWLLEALEPHDPPAN